MKKGILLLAAILSFASVSASNINKYTNKNVVANRYNDAITFTEKNVKFHVFLNGDFDFNAHRRNAKYIDYNGVRIKSKRGIKIKYDYRGRIKRIGNTSINYDYRGNVKRIGRIHMNYKYGRLARVGNLKIKYDRWNNPIFIGNVKNYDYYNDIDININIGKIFNYNHAYFYKRDFKRNYRKYKEDSNYYYYRARPNAKIDKRSKVLKRRKNKAYSKKRKHQTSAEQKGKSRRNR